MKLSIIIPAHNEEDNIVDVIRKVEQDVLVEHELIVVNDHSSDDTANLVRGEFKKYPNIRLVENLADKGFANALKSGFANVTTEFAVPVMGDLCDDLATIDKMQAKIEEGYDIVCGARYSNSGARLGGSKLKGFLSRGAGISLRCFLGIPTSDITNAFKIYKKAVIDSVDIKSSGFEISMEITLKAYYSGFKIAEVPTVWKERTKGKSSFKIFKLLPYYCKLYIWAIYKRIRG